MTPKEWARSIPGASSTTPIGLRVPGPEGKPLTQLDFIERAITSAVADAVAAEREACVEIVERMGYACAAVGLTDRLTAAIRAKRP